MLWALQDGDADLPIVHICEQGRRDRFAALRLCLAHLCCTVGDATARKEGLQPQEATQEAQRRGVWLGLQHCQASCSEGQQGEKLPLSCHLCFMCLPWSPASPAMTVISHKSWSHLKTATCLGDDGWLYDHATSQIQFSTFLHRVLVRCTRSKAQSILPN